MRGRPLHHVALVPRDHTASLRFYCDGLGLRELLDAKDLKGAWPHLFRAPSGILRSIFLGSPEHGNAGVVELLLFSDDVDAATRRGAPTDLAHGFFLLSFYVGDVEATLARLRDLGLDRDAKTATIGDGDHAFTVGTVRDPDGTLIELVGMPPERGFGG